MNRASTSHAPCAQTAIQPQVSAIPTLPANPIPRAEQSDGVALPLASTPAPVPAPVSVPMPAHPGITPLVDVHGLRFSGIFPKGAEPSLNTLGRWKRSRVIPSHRVGRCIYYSPDEVARHIYTKLFVPARTPPSSISKALPTPPPTPFASAPHTLSPQGFKPLVNVEGLRLSGIFPAGKEPCITTLFRWTRRRKLPFYRVGQFIYYSVDEVARHIHVKLLLPAR